MSIATATRTVAKLRAVKVEWTIVRRVTKPTPPRLDFLLRHAQGTRRPPFRHLNLPLDLLRRNLRNLAVAAQVDVGRKI